MGLISSVYKYILRAYGEMAERSKAHAWKVCIRQRIEGSNPSLSAKVPLIWGRALILHLMNQGCYLMPFRLLK